MGMLNVGATMAVHRSEVKQVQHRTRSSVEADRSTFVRTAESQTETWTLHRLPYREIKRRFWHMSPGLLAFGLHVVPHADPISRTLQVIIVCCCVAIALWILWGFGQIKRHGEGAGLAAVSGYSLSVLVTSFLFPRHLELGLAVLSILAFGDGSATLVGLTLRGPRLQWNRGKTWTGLLGFTVFGSVMTAWIYWGETHNPEAADLPVSYGMAMLLTSPAVFAAAVAESIRSRINDNIRVGIVAAMMLVLLHSFRTL